MQLGFSRVHDGAMWLVCISSQYGANADVWEWVGSCCVGCEGIRRPGVIQAGYMYRVMCCGHKRGRPGKLSLASLSKKHAKMTEVVWYVIIISYAFQDMCLIVVRVIMLCVCFAVISCNRSVPDVTTQSILCCTLKEFV